MLKIDASRILTSAVIAVGILGSPMFSNAAYQTRQQKAVEAEKAAAAAAVTSPVKVKDSALIQKVAELKTKKMSTEVDISKASTSTRDLIEAKPKFRTNEELALYNSKQKLVKFRVRLNQASSEAAAEKKLEAKSKALVDKLKRDMESVIKSLESVSIKESAKQELLVKQAALRRSLAEEQDLRKGIKEKIAEAEKEVKTMTRSISETEVKIKDEEIALRKKMMDLAIADKKEFEQKKLQGQKAQVRSTEKLESKANGDLKVAVNNVQRSIDAKVNGIARKEGAKKYLEGIIKQKASLEAKVESLKRELQSTQSSVEDTTKLITEGQEKIMQAEAEVKKLEAAQKTAEEGLAKYKTALSDAQKAVEAAKRQVGK